MGGSGTSGSSLVKRRQWWRLVGDSGGARVAENSKKVTRRGAANFIGVEAGVRKQDRANSMG